MSTSANPRDLLRTRIYQNVVREIVFWSLLCFSLANAVLMAALLAAGFAEGAKASLVYFGLVPIPNGFSSVDKAAMELGLKAVELVLLAPLGYLFVTSMAIFIHALVEEDDNAWVEALHLVEGVKTLATSLLISIVAADLVGKILKDEPMPVATTLIECVIFVLLTGYLAALGRRSTAHGRE
jgi:hypothetical protein